MAGYGTDQGLQDWLDARGYTLPGTAPALAILRQIGSDYLDATYGARWKGDKVDWDQERGWPRIGANVSGQAIPETATPLAIVNASYLAAWQEASSPGSLSGSGTSGQGAIKREKVDVIEVEYQGEAKVEGKLYDPLAPSLNTPIIAEIDGMVRPYLDLSGEVMGVGIWSVGPSSGY